MNAKIRTINHISNRRVKGFASGSSRRDNFYVILCTSFLPVKIYLTLSPMGGFWNDISKRSEGEGDQFCFIYFS